VTGHPSKGEILQLQLSYAIGNLGVFLARLADAREIAFDVGGENRHADAAEAFGHDLQCDRFARAGGAGNQAVTVGHLRQQILWLIALCNQNWFGHDSPRRSLALNAIVASVILAVAQRKRALRMIFS
jgi:hypothetical protein